MNRYDTFRRSYQEKSSSNRKYVPKEDAVKENVPGNSRKKDIPNEDVPRCGEDERKYVIPHRREIECNECSAKYVIPQRREM